MAYNPPKGWKIVNGDDRKSYYGGYNLDDDEDQNETALGDSWTDIKAGTVGVGQALAGLGDFVASPFRDTGDETWSQQYSDATADLRKGFQEEYSDARKAQEEDYKKFVDAGSSEAEKFGRSLLGAVANPRVALGRVMESLPSMAAGGAVGRGALAGATRLAKIAPAAGKMSGVTAQAIGEGVIGGGSTASTVAQYNQEHGYDPARGMWAPVATAVGTAGIARFSGQHGGDVESALFHRTASEASFGKHVAMEGGEEALQAPFETIPTNVATDEEWSEGLGQNTGESLTAGVGMGGVGSVLSPRKKTDLLSESNSKEQEIPNPEPSQPAEPGSATSGSVSEGMTPEDYIKANSVEEEPAAPEATPVDTTTPEVTPETKPADLAGVPEGTVVPPADASGEDKAPEPPQDMTDTQFKRRFRGTVSFGADVDQKTLTRANNIQKSENGQKVLDALSIAAREAGTGDSSFKELINIANTATADGADLATTIDMFRFTANEYANKVGGKQNSRNLEISDACEFVAEYLEDKQSLDQENVQRFMKERVKNRPAVAQTTSGVSSVKQVQSAPSGGSVTAGSFTEDDFVDAEETTTISQEEESQGESEDVQTEQETAATANEPSTDTQAEDDSVKVTAVQEEARATAMQSLEACEKNNNNEATRKKSYERLIRNLTDEKADGYHYYKNLSDEDRADIVKQAKERLSEASAAAEAEDLRKTTMGGEGTRQVPAHVPSADVSGQAAGRVGKVIPGAKVEPSSSEKTAGKKPYVSKKEQRAKELEAREFKNGEKLAQAENIAVKEVLEEIKENPTQVKSSLDKRQIKPGMLGNFVLKVASRASKDFTTDQADVVLTELADYVKASDVSKKEKDRILGALPAYQEARLKAVEDEADDGETSGFGSLASLKSKKEETAEESFTEKASREASSVAEASDIALWTPNNGTPGEKLPAGKGVAKNPEEAKAIFEDSKVPDWVKQTREFVVNKFWSKAGGRWPTQEEYREIIWPALAAKHNWPADPKRVTGHAWSNRYFGKITVGSRDNPKAVTKTGAKVLGKKGVAKAKAQTRKEIGLEVAKQMQKDWDKIRKNHGTAQAQVKPSESDVTIYMRLVNESGKYPGIKLTRRDIPSDAYLPNNANQNSTKYKKQNSPFLGEFDSPFLGKKSEAVEAHLIPDTVETVTKNAGLKEDDSHEVIMQKVTQYLDNRAKGTFTLDENGNKVTATGNVLPLSTEQQTELLEKIVESVAKNENPGKVDAAIMAAVLGKLSDNWAKAKENHKGGNFHRDAVTAIADSASYILSSSKIDSDTMAVYMEKLKGFVKVFEDAFGADTVAIIQDKIRHNETVRNATNEIRADKRYADLEDEHVDELAQLRADKEDLEIQIEKVTEALPGLKKDFAEWEKAHPNAKKEVREKARKKLTDAERRLVLDKESLEKVNSGIWNAEDHIVNPDGFRTSSIVSSSEYSTEVDVSNANVDSVSTVAGAKDIGVAGEAMHNLLYPKNTESGKKAKEPRTIEDLMKLYEKVKQKVGPKKAKQMLADGVRSAVASMEANVDAAIKSGKTLAGNFMDRYLAATDMVEAVQRVDKSVASERGKLDTIATKAYSLIAEDSYTNVSSNETEESEDDEIDIGDTSEMTKEEIAAATRRERSFRQAKKQDEDIEAESIRWYEMNESEDDERGYGLIADDGRVTDGDIGPGKLSEEDVKALKGHKPEEVSKEGAKYYADQAEKLANTESGVAKDLQAQVDSTPDVAIRDATEAEAKEMIDKRFSFFGIFRNGGRSVGGRFFSAGAFKLAKKFHNLNRLFSSPENAEFGNLMVAAFKLFEQFGVHVPNDTWYYDDTRNKSETNRMSPSVEGTCGMQFHNPRFTAHDTMFQKSGYTGRLDGSAIGINSSGKNTRDYGDPEVRALVTPQNVHVAVHETWHAIDAKTMYQFFDKLFAKDPGWMHINKLLALDEFLLNAFNRATGMSLIDKDAYYESGMDKDIEEKFGVKFSYAEARAFAGCTWYIKHNYENEGVSVFKIEAFAEIMALYMTNKAFRKYADSCKLGGYIKSAMRMYSSNPVEAESHMWTAGSTIGLDELNDIKSEFAEGHLSGGVSEIASGVKKDAVRWRRAGRTVVRYSQSNTQERGSQTGPRERQSKSSVEASLNANVESTGQLPDGRHMGSSGNDKPASSVRGSSGKVSSESRATHEEMEDLGAEGGRDEGYGRSSDPDEANGTNGNSRDNSRGYNPTSSSSVQGAIRRSWLDAKRSARGVLRGLYFMRDIVNRAMEDVKDVPAFKAFHEASERQLAERNRRQAEIADIARKFYSLKDTEQKKANEFWTHSTLENVWAFYDQEVFGSVAEWDTYLKKLKKEKKAVHDKLKAEFEALSPEAQDVVRAAILNGVRTRRDKADFTKANVEKIWEKRMATAAPSELKALEAMKKADLDRIEKAKKAAGNPYMPLKRFGSHAVYVKSAELQRTQEMIPKLKKALEAKYGENMTSKQKHPLTVLRRRYEALLADEAHYKVMFVDGEGMAAERAESLRKQYPGKGYKVDYFERAEFASSKVPAWGKLEQILYALDRRAMEEPMDPKAMKGEAKEIDKMRLIAEHLYIESLSEDSARKADLKRMAVAGFHANMMENFMENGRAQAQFIANLRYGTQAREALDQMTDQVKASSERNLASQYANEITARYEQVISNKGDSTLVNVALRTNSFMMLMTSPAYYIQNLLQPIIMSAPYIAGEYGIHKAVAGIGKNMVAVTKGLRGDMSVETIAKNMGLSKEEREALEKARDLGHIDVGMSSDFGRITRTESNKAVGALIGATDRMTDWSRNVEMVNRISTFLTAYRLKRAEASADVAWEYADETVYRTQGDYSGYNAPRWFNAGKFMRIATQYRKFQLIQIGMFGALLRKSFEGATPKERAIAKKQLIWNCGMLAAFGGAKALPAASTVMFLATAVFGGDDGDDAEDEIRKAIGNKAYSDLLLNGFPKALGVELTQKIGAGDMLTPFPFWNPKSNQKDGATKELAYSVFGPTGSMAGKIEAGFHHFTKGEYWKGMEYMLPTGLSNVAKAVRFASEGMTTKSGETTLPANEFNANDIVAQIMGMPTNKVTDARRLTGVLLRHKDAFYQRREKLIDMYQKGWDSRRTREGQMLMIKARKEWREMQKDQRKQKLSITPIGVLNRSGFERYKRSKLNEKLGAGVSAKRTEARFVEKYKNL